MAFIEKLIASDENVANLVGYNKGVVTELDEHEMLLLQALEEKHTVHPLGSVMLGRGIPRGEPNEIGQPGIVIEDNNNPDGVWLQYVPA